MGKDSFSDVMKRNMELNMAVQASKGADGKPDPYKASAMAASLGHRSAQDAAMMGALLGSQGAFDKSSDKSTYAAESYTSSKTYRSHVYDSSDDSGNEGSQSSAQMGGIIRDDSYASHYDRPPRNHKNGSRNRKIMWFIFAVLVLSLIAYGVSASIPRCAYEGCDESPMQGSDYCERHDSIMKLKKQNEQYRNDLLSGKEKRPTSTQTEAATESNTSHATTEASTSYYKRKNSSATESKRSLDGYDNPDDFAGDTYDEFDGENDDDRYESAYEYWEEEAEEVEDEE